MFSPCGSSAICFGGDFFATGGGRGLHDMAFGLDIQDHFFSLNGRSKLNIGLGR